MSTDMQPKITDAEGTGTAEAAPVAGGGSDPGPDESSKPVVKVMRTAPNTHPRSTRVQEIRKCQAERAFADYRKRVNSQRLAKLHGWSDPT